MRALIVELGRRYNLISSATSFVAVEERAEDAQSERAELRRVPIALTKGWHGIEMICRSALHPCSETFCARRSKAILHRTRSGWQPPALGGMGEGAKKRIVCKIAPAKAEVCPVKSRSSERAESLSFGWAQSPDPLMELVAKQGADGTWALCHAALARAAGTQLKKLRSAAGELDVAKDLGFRIVATLAAVDLLERLHADREDEWRLLVDKSRCWLAAQKVAAPDGSRSLTEWIKRVLDA